ncbi:unnamed protein product [Acanthoscelides obtectus]|uniref:Transposase n=1 Tax=Acanthoscelides obtectus TaxID=200917 RepID=A0A9P0K4Y3_ACAOB|nr:unnamed protein product [Acanthoscelides obtectus]CAK1620230.1 hypothetical protein AOBTE_LOCUS251 [Acanthoscelides obtectus]
MELFAKYRIVEQTAEIFNQRHENSNVHRKYVLEPVAKFRETGTRKLETVCGVSRHTVQRILKAHNAIDPALTAIIENQNDRRYIANRLMFQQDDRWTDRRGAIEWPPRSPDLSPLDFFMWGHLKSKIYATQPTSLEDLRQRIVNECLQITPQILQNVRQRFEQNLYYCMEIITW